ncbi:Gfo/Idh/MocA family oxidoreductase [Mesobacillus subterraneus]|uniref:Gfo/Idh/MocA family protein n=1 Tax=Mesobacillus subterraneus TaxID=285983 RepID=UPI00203B1D50|nr:Gfo/Idh/MocA family oxidoreductase [Mesobacillus subterraneus]MCM3667011.1 Gfo/Idh/MocA family oxidoreductase [Mesobacillus subterraneus]
MKRLLTIGLLGAGNIAERHAKAFSKLSDVRVKTVVDIDAVKARNIANILQAEVATELDKVLEDQEIDAIDICFPTFLHKETVIKAAKGKKHILCEKPIALSIDDAIEMYRVCKEHKVKLMIAQVCRFMPPYIRMKNLISDGTIGEIHSIRMTRAVDYPVHNGYSWYQDINKSGGPFLDFIIHDFDFLAWSFGKPTVVSSHQIHSNSMQGIFVHLKYEYGPFVRLEGIWSSKGNKHLHQRIEVDGQHGSAVFDSKGKYPFSVSSLNDYTELLKEEPEVDPFYEELKHFVDSILNNTEVLIKESEVLTALETALAARERAGLNIETRSGYAKRN